MNKLEYLTINNITKICSDLIYTDSRGHILPYQWFPFQLEYVFNRLGLQIYNNGLRYTNKQMGELLKSFFFNKDIIVEDNKENLIANGIYGSEKIKDTYTIANYGGHLQFNPEANEYGSSVKKPSGRTFYSLEPPKNRTIQIKKLITIKPKIVVNKNCKFTPIYGNIDGTNPIVSTIIVFIINYLKLNSNRVSYFKELLNKSDMGKILLNIENKSGEIQKATNSILNIVNKDKQNSAYLFFKEILDKSKIEYSDYNNKKTYLFSDKNTSLDTTVEDFYFSYRFNDNSYDKQLVSTNDNQIVLTNIASSKLIKFYDSLKINKVKDDEVNANPDLYEEDLELGIMTKKKGVDKLNIVLKKNKIEVPVTTLLRTKNISLPVPSLKKDLDFNLKSVIVENEITSKSNYIFIGIDRKVQRVKNGIMQNSITQIRVVPLEIIKLENSIYYLTGIICMTTDSDEYISYIRCDNKYYSYSSNISGEPIEIGDYTKLMEVDINGKVPSQKGQFISKNSVFIFYEKL